MWVTPSGMYNQNQFTFILSQVGAERIIHSEDFPYVVRDNVSDFLDEAELTAEQRTAIAHRNAENLMRISQAADHRTGPLVSTAPSCERSQVCEE